MSFDNFLNRLKDSPFFEVLLLQKINRMLHDLVTYIETLPRFTSQKVREERLEKIRLLRVNISTAEKALDEYKKTPILERKLESDFIIERFENNDPKKWGFQGVAGMDDLKKLLLQNFIKPLKFRFLIDSLDGTPDTPTETFYNELHATYSKFQVTIPTGLLLYGPPGTGKTFIARKLAEELGAGFIQKSVGEFGTSLIHKTSQNIRSFFQNAKKASEKEPIILFLDEIDALVASRTETTQDYKAEELSQFLQEFNSLDTSPSLIVVAATNRPDQLDSAILRSGRFDKKIYIGPPDELARKELFHLFLTRMNRPHEELDYMLLAQQTEGYVSSDIELICEEAARVVGQSVLDLATKSLESMEAIEQLRNSLNGHKITMNLLQKIIIQTSPSLQFVDMSIYDKFVAER